MWKTAADLSIERRAARFMAWLKTSPVHVAEYLAIAGLARDLDTAANTTEIPLEPLLARAPRGDESGGHTGSIGTGARASHDAAAPVALLAACRRPQRWHSSHWPPSG